MSLWLTLALVIGGLALLAALAYWQLDIAEGAYLGQPVVTWLYDLTAGRYDRIKGYDPDMETAFLGRPLAQALRHIPDPLVLDVATGTGRLPVTLFEQPAFHGYVVGVDASRPMLSIAARKLHGYEHRLMLIWRDARDLPFPDGTFDAVTCLEMLEFTPNPEAQLAEVVRVLRPGGLLLTTRRRGINARLMPGRTHSREELRALLERLSIERVEIQPWQVEYDLVWGIRRGQSAASGRHPISVLACPLCDTIAWIEETDRLTCRMCGVAFPIRNGILEMAHRSPIRTGEK